MPLLNGAMYFTCEHIASPWSLYGLFFETIHHKVTPSVQAVMFFFGVSGFLRRTLVKSAD